jgi:hypothetical protein
MLCNFHGKLSYVYCTYSNSLLYFDRKLTFQYHHVVLVCYIPEQGGGEGYGAEQRRQAAASPERLSSPESQEWFTGARRVPSSCQWVATVRLHIMQGVGVQQAQKGFCGHA